MQKTGLRKLNIFVYSVMIISVLSVIVFSVVVIKNSVTRPQAAIKQMPITKLNLKELVSKGPVSSEPMSYDNLLVYAVRIKAISSSLNKAIKQSGLNLPPIEIQESHLSYKDKDNGEARGWISQYDDVIILVLYHDVSDILDSNEVLAVAIHEISHAILGHKSGPNYQRNIIWEKDADQLTVDAGVDPMTLIAAISKLSADNEEKVERIAALAQLHKSQ